MAALGSLERFSYAFISTIQCLNFRNLVSNFIVQTRNRSLLLFQFCLEKQALVRLGNRILSSSVLELRLRYGSGGIRRLPAAEALT